MKLVIIFGPQAVGKMTVGRARTGEDNEFKIVS